MFSLSGGGLLSPTIASATEPQSMIVFGEYRAAQSNAGVPTLSSICIVILGVALGVIAFARLT